MCLRFQVTINFLRLHRLRCISDWIGVVLLQEGRLAAYDGRQEAFSTDVNYTTVEQELCAVVHAMRHGVGYLEGVKFTMVADHRRICRLNLFCLDVKLGRQNTPVPSDADGNTGRAGSV